MFDFFALSHTVITTALERTLLKDRPRAALLAEVSATVSPMRREANRPEPTL